MKILLINHNPVVSRLTTLSAKKENVQLDEIKEISELKASDYSVVFVDNESYNHEVENLLTNSDIDKKVLFYAQGEEESQANFSESILKPFLPSEVSAILRETKIEHHNKEQESASESEEEFADLMELVGSREKTIDNLNLETSAQAVADTVEQEKVELDTSLFDEPVSETKENDLDTLNLLKQELEAKQSDTPEPKSTEADLKAETANAQQDELNLQLEEAFPLDLDNKEEKSPTKEERFENVEATKETDNALFELDKEIETNTKEDILDFDLESQNEVDFSAETQSEVPTQEAKDTQILDSSEISNIKALLDDESKILDETQTLDDVITPSIPLVQDEPTDTKKKKKKEKKREFTPEADEEALTHSNALVETI
ncbi:MAG TPA: hypothetical protein ENK86_01990, partial [Campylobacterales bacterium]|nr:hypothetical protein [Campylobacterales bacterium]